MPSKQVPGFYPRLSVYCGMARVNEAVRYCKNLKTLQVPGFYPRRIFRLGMLCANEVARRGGDFVNFSGCRVRREAVFAVYFADGDAVTHFICRAVLSDRFRGSKREKF